MLGVDGAVAGRRGVVGNPAGTWSTGLAALDGGVGGSSSPGCMNVTRGGID